MKRGLNNAAAGNNPTGNVLSNDTDVDTSGNGETKTIIGIAAVRRHLPRDSVAAVSLAATIHHHRGRRYVFVHRRQYQQRRSSSTYYGQTLSDVFTYTLTDAGGLTSSTQITITIRGANDTPTSNADSASATEAGGLANGTAGNNPTGDVLTNDSDVDAGDTKTLIGVAAGVQMMLQVQ